MSGMNRVFLLAILLAAATARGVTFHRSFRNGYPAGAQGVTGVTREVGVATNSILRVGGSEPTQGKAGTPNGGKKAKRMDTGKTPPGKQPVRRSQLKVRK